MWIKDTRSGKVRPYGIDSHDALRISENGRHLSYENLQNGDGSEGGGYLFCGENGEMPAQSEAWTEYGARMYADIGGDAALAELRHQIVDLFRAQMEKATKIKNAFERAKKNIEADEKTGDYYSELSKKDLLAIFEEELMNAEGDEDE